MAMLYCIEVWDKKRKRTVYTYATPDEFGGMLATIARETPELLVGAILSYDDQAPEDVVSC